jgi:hypothetical protein
VLEFDCGQVNGETEVSDRIDREGTLLRDLEPVILGVVYLEVEISEGVASQNKGKFLDDGTGWLDIIGLCAGVLKSQEDA